MKKAFLVVYDYGQGGVWAYVRASSAADVRRRFPELEVVESPPQWMSSAEVERIRRTMTFDAENPRGWLRSVVEARPPTRDRSVT